MDEEMEYDGEIYINRNGKWHNKSYCEVPVSLQLKLNSVYNNSINKKIMTYTQLIKLGDKYKNSGSYTLAIEAYEKALSKKINNDNIRYILPRITSCYRKSNQARKAVELYSNVCKKYGYDILNVPLLASVAAAYCDLGEYYSAKKCVNKALKLLQGECPDELKSLIIKINKHMIVDGNVNEWYYDKNIKEEIDYKLKNNKNND